MDLDIIAVDTETYHFGGGWSMHAVKFSLWYWNFSSWYWVSKDEGQHYFPMLQMHFEEMMCIQYRRITFDTIYREISSLPW